ncbi:hypothetical protein A2U01_0100896, partial [Trifolium medium]|nr:hypothetical protein [Trifolium medium]
ARRGVVFVGIANRDWGRESEDRNALGVLGGAGCVRVNRGR